MCGVRFQKLMKILVNICEHLGREGIVAIADTLLTKM